MLYSNHSHRTVGGESVVEEFISLNSSRKTILVHDHANRDADDSMHFLICRYDLKLFDLYNRLLRYLDVLATVVQPCIGFNLMRRRRFYTNM